MTPHLDFRQRPTNILMFQVFEQLQLSICAFRQHRGAEWFHDLLDCNGLAGQLVSRRAFQWTLSVPVLPQKSSPALR